MRADDFLPSSDDQPPINKALEDVLALAVTEDDRAEVLTAWMQLGTQYAARQCGRTKAAALLVLLLEHVRSARPTPDWPA